MGGRDLYKYNLHTKIIAYRNNIEPIKTGKQAFKVANQPSFLA